MEHPPIPPHNTPRFGEATTSTMPSVVNEQSSTSGLPPIAPSVPIKPTMTKLRIPTEQQKEVRVQQALPPLPLSIPPAQESLPPGFVARANAIRSSSPTVSPVKPARSMSHPVPAHLPIQLPPTVPEERNGSIDVGVSTIYRQTSGSSPVLERNSANSRFSMRPRASTTNSLVRRNSRPIAGELGDSPVDEDAQRWAEEIRKKRESKRRWKEAEDEDRVIVGNKVDASHPNYITAYNMLTGLRVAVFASCLWNANDVGVPSKRKDKSRLDGCGFHILPKIHI